MKRMLTVILLATLVLSFTACSMPKLPGKLLKQGQYTPMEAADQVISIFAVNEGFADGIELKDIAAYEKGLIPWVNSRWPELHARINTGRKLDEDELKRLRTLIARYTDSLKA